MTMAEEEQKNEVAPIFGGGMVDIANSDEYVNAMEDTVDEGARGGDVSFMNFSGKKGTYKIGVDERAPGLDEPFLVAISAFELGWICWKGKKPISKRMASIAKPKIPEPPAEEGGPFEKDGEGWHRARAITVRSLENGEQCYFAINSKSGVAVMSDLQRDILDRARAGQPAWPIVTFSSEDFEAGGYTNSKPVIDVVKWLSFEDIEQLADPDCDPMSLLGEVEEKKETKAPKPRRRL